MNDRLKSANFLLIDYNPAFSQLIESYNLELSLLFRNTVDIASDLELEAVLTVSK